MLQTYERRKLAALEVESLVQTLAKQDQLGRIYLLVDTLANNYADPASGNNNARKGACLCLAAVAVGLAGTPASQHEDFIRRVAPPILTACTDPDSRVRYYALEALYNVAKSTRPAILVVFPEIFDVLFRLCSDPDRSVQNASSILDELMKSTIADAPTFPLEDFLPKLAQAMAVDSSQQRSFLLGWISLLDGLPHADVRLLRALPQLLPGLLDFQGDRAPEVQNAASKLLQQLLQDAADDPSRVNVPALATALMQWLAENEVREVIMNGNKGSAASATAMTWLRALVAAAPKQLRGQAPDLVRTSLKCLDTADSRLQALGVDLNETLIRTESLLVGADIGALLETAAEGIGSMQEAARLEALRWTAKLIEVKELSARELEPSVLPALCDALSSTSDRVVQEAVLVLAAASGAGDNGCRRALSSVLGCFRGLQGAKLLQRRGATIVERLCSRMGARRILRALAELLAQEQDVEFGRMMSQAVSLMLLTSPELDEARVLLGRALIDAEGAAFLMAVLPGLCLSVAAALSVAFLAQAYGLAGDMIGRLAEQPLLADMSGSVVELGQVVTLLEAPAFAGMRLQLLIPRRHPELLRALYSLLLVLPQGEAFRLLRQRLDCVPGQGVLEGAEFKTSKSQKQVGAGEKSGGGGCTATALAQLLDIFTEVQKRKLASEVTR